MKISAKCEVSVFFKAKGEEECETKFIEDWFTFDLTGKHKDLFLQHTENHDKRTILQGFLQSEKMNKMLKETGEFQGGRVAWKTVLVLDFKDGEHKEDEPKEVVVITKRASKKTTKKARTSGAIAKKKIAKKKAAKKVIA